MQFVRNFITHLQILKQRRQAQRMLRTHCDDEAKKLLALKIGLPVDQRTAILKADASLPATILASDVRYDDALAPVLEAQFTLLEKGRLAEAETLNPLEEQYANRVAQFSDVKNACTVPGGGIPDQPGLEARLDTLKNDLVQIRRRARSFLWRAGGMGTLGALLFAGDLILIYQNFVLLLSNQNTDALTLSITSIVSTLLVVLLLLVLTHLGLAPLFHDALETVRRNKAGSLDRKPASQKEEKKWNKREDWEERFGLICHALLTHLLSLFSCTLTLVVSFLVARMRQILVVDDDSGGVFIALGTLGLPVLSLFIHLCFTASHTLWVQYRVQKDAWLDAIKPMREVDGALGRIEKQRRRTLPISRELLRIEKAFARGAEAAYQRTVNHPGSKSAIRRLAEQLVPTPSPASTAATDTVRLQTGDIS